MHTIIIVGDTAYGAQCRAALEGTEGLDEIEQLLLVEEKTDAIGCLGGIARSTQQKALQLDGMSLLIKGIGAIPCLAVNLGRESAIGIKGEVGIGTAESKLFVIFLQLCMQAQGQRKEIPFSFLLSIYLFKSNSLISFAFFSFIFPIINEEILL